MVLCKDTPSTCSGTVSLSNHVVARFRIRARTLLSRKAGSVRGKPCSCEISYIRQKIFSTRPLVLLLTAQKELNVEGKFFVDSGKVAVA
jgi:hypothetical protein